MAVALVLVIVAIGSVVFHLLSPWWWTPIASNWSYIDHTLNLTFWITGVVFVAIVLFMAYCVYRFRHRPGQRGAYEPENKKLEWWLTVATSVGVAAMLAPGLFVWHQFVTVPDDAVEIEVVGQQWRWSYRLPGADGRLGTSDIRHISADNPLGLNPDDPAGQDDVVLESEDLHLPVGRPVKVLLRSIDVLHDFYVPEFRAKMDMIPGSVTYFLLVHADPDRDLRGALRGAVRHRPCGDARPRGGPERGRPSGLAGGAADLRAARAAPAMRQGRRGSVHRPARPTDRGDAAGGGRG
jgi:cytochrome c oxidase subunit 2